MQVGTYADGRALNYDETSRGFDVGGLPVTPEQVLGYDQAGQLSWLSDEMKNWTYLYAANYRAGTTTPPPTIVASSSTEGASEGLPSQAVAGNSAPTEPPLPDDRGWFSRLSTGGQVAFLFFYPIAIPYGIWATLKKGGRFSQLPTWAKVLFVLFYPVSITYGVWAMWRDRRFSQSVRIMLTVIASAFAVYFVFIIATHTSISDTTSTVATGTTALAPAPAPPATPVPSPAAAAAPAPASPAPDTPRPDSQSAQDFLRSAAVDIVGAQTNMDKPRVRSVEYDGDGVYLIALNSDDNFTTNMIKGGMWMNTLDLWERVFTQRKDIKTLFIHWYFPVSDVKGNSSDESVMSLTMTAKNAAGVNWANALNDNVPQIADKYYESPVLSK